MKATQYLPALILSSACFVLTAFANVHSERCSSTEQTTVVYQFENEDPYYASTEGIAIDRWGNTYISYRSFDGANFVENKLLCLDRKGSLREVASFGPAAPGCLGILGLATDHWGIVYAAVMSGDANHGVWKIHPSGNKTKLDGSDQIFVPNALAFDQKGNLYVTDSFPIDPSEPGLVWRYRRKQGSFEIWASSHLLAPDPVNDPVSPPPPAPPVKGPGANGIVFVPPNSLYVANTEKCLILRIDIERNGDAGAIAVIAGEYPFTAPPGLLFAPDGLAADSRGYLYTVIPPAGFTPFPTSPLIRIDPRSGAVEAVVPSQLGPFENFNFSTSLAIGGRGNDRKCALIVGITGRLYGFPTDPPELVRVYVGPPDKEF